MPNQEEVMVDEDEVRVDTFRGSGAGGQHRNKTSSAVRLTHLPTGITAVCQSERSQYQNRNNAWRILRARIAAHLAPTPVINGEAAEVVKTYNLCGQAMVINHRLGTRYGNPKPVLNGQLELVW